MLFIVSRGRREGGRRGCFSALIRCRLGSVMELEEWQIITYRRFMSENEGKSRLQTVMTVRTRVTALFLSPYRVFTSCVAARRAHANDNAWVKMRQLLLLCIFKHEHAVTSTPPREHTVKIIITVNIIDNTALIIPLSPYCKRYVGFLQSGASVFVSGFTIRLYFSFISALLQLYSSSRVCPSR